MLTSSHLRVGCEEEAGVILGEEKIAGILKLPQRKFRFLIDLVLSRLFAYAKKLRITFNRNILGAKRVSKVFIHGFHPFHIPLFVPYGTMIYFFSYIVKSFFTF